MKLILDRNHLGRCPNCGSVSIRRSRRKDLLESFLHFVLFISPFRCNDCDNRHLRLRSAKKIQRPAAPSPKHAS
jgi:hypothetical protein